MSPIVWHKIRWYPLKIEMSVFQTNDRKELKTQGTECQDPAGVRINSINAKITYNNSGLNDKNDQLWGKFWSPNCFEVDDTAKPDKNIPSTSMELLHKS